jgi:hypothetical protein
MTHLTYGCSTSPFKKLKLPKYQILLQMSLKKSVEGTVSNQLGFMKNDQKILNNELVEYFIESEMPFRHVENTLFRKLKKLLKPRFKLSSHITLQKDGMKLYEKEKLALKTVLCGKRVCVTTDT